MFLRKVDTINTLCNGISRNVRKPFFLLEVGLKCETTIVFHAHFAVFGVHSSCVRVGSFGKNVVES